MSKEKFNLREYINSEKFEVDFKELLDFEKVGSTEKIIIECKTAILNYDSIDMLEAILYNNGLNIDFKKLSEKKEAEYRKAVQHRVNGIFAKEENDLNIYSEKKEYIELFKKIGFIEYYISEDQTIFIDHKNNLLINVIDNDDYTSYLLLANGSLRKHIKEEDILVEVLGNSLSGIELDYISVDLKELPYFKIQKTIEMYNCSKLYYLDKKDLFEEKNRELILNNNDNLKKYFNSTTTLPSSDNIQTHMEFLFNLSLEEKEDILYRMSIFKNSSKDRLLFNSNLIDKLIENNIDINIFKISLNLLKEKYNTIINSVDNYKKVILTFSDFELKQLKERTVDEKYENLSDEEKKEIDNFINKNEKLINVSRKIMH